MTTRLKKKDKCQELRVNIARMWNKNTKGHTSCNWGSIDPILTGKQFEKIALCEVSDLIESLIMTRHQS